MAIYTVKRYEPADASLWNDFIRKSKNGTFLFERGFMEYHHDRFDDCSLLVFDANELLAVLPAHKIENRVYSHWGLTYGGLVYDEKLKLKEVICVVKSILQSLRNDDIETLHIKLIPTIYHKFPSDELLYALFTANAQLTRRDALSVIDLKNGFRFTKTRRESIARGKKNGLEIREEPNFDLFWNDILIPNLDKRHQVQPVHSAAEIILLHSRFPQNIRHFNVYHNNKIVAGTTIFVTDTVAHPQYISGNAQKNDLGSLDFLYHFLITEVFKEKAFFDFGISNEQQGRKLNEGLVFWKESFGANTIAQDFYEVNTENHKLLETVLI